MKLMACPRCGDVVALRREPRSCACGRARGRYLADGATVEQTLGSISLGLHNGDLGQAIRQFGEAPERWRPAFLLRAYLNPASEDDVTFVERLEVSSDGS